MPQRGGGDGFQAASHAHPGSRLRTFKAHQEQATFALALDLEDIPGTCRRKDHAPLGIRATVRLSKDLKDTRDVKDQESASSFHLALSPRAQRAETFACAARLPINNRHFAILRPGNPMPEDANPLDDEADPLDEAADPLDDDADP
jgi:hypothetical protein